MYVVCYYHGWLVRDVFLSVRVGVGSLVIKSYIMNRPLLSRLTSCGTDSYARGIQYRLSVRVSLPLRGLNNSALS